jgi:hypothetical protein
MAKRVKKAKAVRVEKVKTVKAPEHAEQKEAASPAGRKYSNIGIILAFVCWIFLPIVFGPLAVIFGVMGYLGGDKKRAIIAMVLGIVFALLSTAVAVIIMGAM